MFAGTVRITLTDENDNAPMIDGQTLLSVSESVLVGTEVSSFSAIDADQFQNVTFTIPDQDSSFSISANGKKSN